MIVLVDDEDGRLAVLIDDRLLGHLQHVGLAGLDFAMDEHAGLQRRVLRQRDIDHADPGGGIDRRADQADLALEMLRIGVVDDDGRGLAGLQLRQVHLGHLGLQLDTVVADHPEQLLADGDDIAQFRHALRHGAVRGRADFGLGQLGRPLIGDRLGGHQILARDIHVGLGGGQRGLALLGDLAADITVLRQFLGAADIGVGGARHRLRLAQPRVGLGDGGLSLGVLGLQHGIVQLRQQLALGHLVALFYRDLDDRQAAGLGADRQFVPGGQRAVDDQCAAERCLGDSAHGDRLNRHGLHDRRLMPDQLRRDDRGNADDHQRAQADRPAARETGRPHQRHVPAARRHDRLRRLAVCIHEGYGWNGFQLRGHAGPQMLHCVKYLLFELFARCPWAPRFGPA